MSCLRIPTKFRRDRDTPKTPDYTLIPTKRPHPCSNQPAPFIYLANGQMFTQDPTLPTKTGQVGFRDAPATGLPSLKNLRRTGEELKGDEQQSPSLILEDVFEAGMSVHVNKRNKQSRQWTTTVIPQLVYLYMKLLWETDNLHEESSFFTASVELHWKFVNAPLRVSSSYRWADICVLEFVRELFLRVAPNHRAWCNTVTEFLDRQGYHITGKDPLRRRFSNALQWYNSLRHATKGLVDRNIQRHREGLFSIDENDEDLSPAFSLFTPSSQPHSSMDEYDYPPEMSLPSLRPTSPLLDVAKDSLADNIEGDMNDSDGETDGFGNKRAHLENMTTKNQELDFDLIVCIDACFTQKHNKTRAWDPLKKHPDTLWLSEDELRSAEEYVESLRPSDPKPTGDGEEQEGEDGFDGTMQLPRLALDGCHESFTAADECHQKASTQFFDCTGVMALLCRHDRVLWLANMFLAGEKQFYVIALLRKLFENLPDDFLIGLLYDIECQLDRSCNKWGFLEEFHNRLAFAISVFHAFGHHWACQLIYHPRKRKGFGLSDGEGCEQFWHSISHLISFLRVCGVEHTDEESQQGLAVWLTRKMSDAQVAVLNGARRMESSGETKAFLREQWELHVQEQTKPLPLEMLQKKVSEFEKIAMDLDADDFEHAQAVQDLPDAQRKLADAQKKHKSKEHLLGVEESQAVQHLVASLFLRDRMKALVLKS
ncbi:hypothetical protein V5O48_015694 [Marasmius crinis-equi]|uniref:Uncharacterized protein n=1 Tax=Marasmius crinis-equi TaxID=585013 RepID=A0ABR3ETV7_9AGAR